MGLCGGCMWSNVGLDAGGCNSLKKQYFDDLTSEMDVSQPNLSITIDLM